MWHEYRIYRIYKIYRIYIESVESSDSIESIESIQSIEPIESIELRESTVLVRADFKQLRVLPFWKCYVNDFFVFVELCLSLGTPVKSSGTL